MTLYDYKSTYINPFYGNRNRTITSIDESGGIVCARTSGQTPCFIHASASAILASGTDRPYEDGYYLWDFGDPSSTETFSNPGVGLGTVNSNLQSGPEAVHCYRSAGTYTITLTIYFYNPSGLKKKTVTQQITVSAFDTSGGEYWADSAAGGTNAGTLANPFNTIAAINTAIAATSYKSLHVKRDSDFTGSVGLLPWNTGSALGNTGLRIDAYGSGAKPIFNISSGSNAPFRLTNGGSSSPRPKADIVVSNIVFKNSGTSVGGCVSIVQTDPPVADLSDIYFDNCESYLEADNASAQNWSFGGHIAGRVGLWNCTAYCDQVRTFSTMGFLGGCTEWFFIYGGSFEGGTFAGGTTFDHHIYPGVQRHSVHRWIDFKNGTNRNYCINMNWDHQGVDLPEIAENHFIADCGATGVQRFHDASEQANRPSYTLFRNLVVQGNRIHDMNDNGTILFYCVQHYTHRFNQIWNIDGGANYFLPDPTALGSIIKSRVYGNMIYRGADATDGASYNIGNANFTQLQEFTDNIIVDLRTTAKIAIIPATQQAGALIDRNQYWFPNDSNAKALYDLTTQKSFAEWQALGFDLNGSVADPGWTDAANGDFT